MNSKRLLKKERFYWLKVLLDGMMLTGSFLLIYYLRRGDLDVEPAFRVYYLVLFLCWFIVTLLSKKFTEREEESYISRVKPFLMTGLVLTGLVSAAIIVLGWYHLSRLIVFGTIAVFLVMENVYLSIHSALLLRSGKIRRIPFSVIFFYLELVLVVTVFMIIFSIRKGTLRLSEDYMVLLMGIYFIWFVVSLLIHRFEIRFSSKLVNVLYPFWKSEIIIVGLTTYSLYLLNLTGFSRFVILGSLVCFALAENLIVIVFHLMSREQPRIENRVSLFRPEPIEYEPPSAVPGRPRQGKYCVPGCKLQSRYLRQLLKEVHLKNFPLLYQFIDSSVQLTRVDVLKSLVHSSRTTSLLDLLDDGNFQFILNLRRMNDLRRINHTLALVNRKLEPGGIFIGCFEGKRQLSERIYATYPAVPAKLILALIFVFKRVLPKLPLVWRLYFRVTRGMGRVISKAEALGRLYYSGFQLENTMVIDHQTWFIAVKEAAPNPGPPPAYGPFFKQKRVGKGGKPIYMLKVRTMHPYSEYLHAYMLAHHSLDEGGKIKDDFRINEWGRFFRRYLIDELPMLLNWIRRDVKLVGVRPISETFFDTYPEDLARMRITYKPGLIPPFYADMPATMEEIWQSERTYLERYAKRPLRTDVSYFFRALKNILFHHAKSQ